MVPHGRPRFPFTGGGVALTLDDLIASRAAVVTVAQAASVFGVDVRTVTRAIENGALPAVRLGRRVLIRGCPCWRPSASGAMTSAPTFTTPPLATGKYRTRPG